MKKKLPIILLGVILACVLVFGFLYANNDIGKTANSLEADIRQSQKILDDWIVDGSISDTMAAFISYPQDKTDHTFSVYVNRPGLSFGYFFRGGGDIVEVDDYIAEFVVEGNNERAFISMNTQNIVRLEVDDGNGIQVIDIDSGKPFAIVLPLNVGNICFYDTNGNAGLKAATVQYAKTRPVFEQYKATKYSRKFLAEHEADLELYRAAQAEMRSLLGGAKLPKMDVLKEEGRKLTAKKKQLYGEYQKARRDMQEIVTIKANIDTLMGYTEPGRKQEKER